MHRTQLLLQPWQYEALKSMSERQGKSISELVRQVLDDYLTTRPARRRGRLSDLDGFFDDPGTSGRDHDRHLHGRAKPR